MVPLLSSMLFKLVLFDLGIISGVGVGDGDGVGEEEGVGLGVVTFGA